ncbi:ROK family protein [soil metagenome]
MANTLAIGVDFGGTKVLASVVDVRNGEILGSSKKRTNSKDSTDQLVDRLIGTIDDAIADADLSKKQRVGGIGIGIAGQVDSETGVLLGAPNLSQATVDLPLADLISDRYKVTTTLLNDVQIAAIGESRFGAGNGVDLFLCVFVGTGVGGAVVQDGKVLRGISGSAGEIGHLVIHANGRICGCGGRGHLEAYASRTAITQAIVGELKRGQPSSLRESIPELQSAAPGGTAIRSGVLARAIDGGDDLCIDIVNDAAYYLGLGIASAINLINPARVILGGGVIESVPLLFDNAAKHARRESLPSPGKAVSIVRAALGDNAGVVGAAIVGIGGEE